MVVIYNQTNIDYSILSKEHKKIYHESENYVSDKYLMRCICGRLCTGLHERSCRKFRLAVNKEFLRRIK